MAVQYSESMVSSAEKREKEAFGRKLRKARERRFPSAEGFAKLLGLDPHRYRHYERGDSYPPVPIMQRICSHLGVTQSYLLSTTQDIEDAVELVKKAAKQQ